MGKARDAIIGITIMAAIGYGGYKGIDYLFFDHKKPAESVIKTYDNPIKPYAIKDRLSGLTGQRFTEEVQKISAEVKKANGLPYEKKMLEEWMNANRSAYTGMAAASQPASNSPRPEATPTPHTMVEVKTFDGKTDTFDPATTKTVFQDVVFCYNKKGGSPTPVHSGFRDQYQFNKDVRCVSGNYTITPLED